MNENKTYTGNQYRATKIWNEIIESFKTSIPLKRHWRNLKSYSDCFTANEAIEWLYNYLKTSPNFKSQTLITRQKAIQLLQIFLKQKIIEDVRGDKYNNKEFQDDDRLYKFCSVEEHRIQYRKDYEIKTKSIEQTVDTDVLVQKKLTNNINIYNSNTNQNLITTSLTTKEIVNVQQTRRLSVPSKILKEKTNVNQENAKQTLKNDNYELIGQDKLATFSHKAKSTHKDAFVKSSSTSTAPSKQDSSEVWSTLAVSCLYDILKLDKTNNLFENIKISSSNIQYNCTHVNKHGVVTNTNKSDDLPAWVMQAMTSLVHWSDFKKDQQNKLNHHPSFKDVFNEVTNYYNDHNEPLLTQEFSTLLLKIMRIFLSNTKQFEIDEFMRNLKAHLNANACLKQQNNDIDMIVDYVDDDEAEDDDGIVANGDDDEDDDYGDDDVFCEQYDDHNCQQFNFASSSSQATHMQRSKSLNTETLAANNHEICCSQCLSTYDFVNNWLNCNEIEFNDFVLNLNTNYRLLNHDNEPFSAEEEENMPNSINATAATASATITDSEYMTNNNKTVKNEQISASENERKLRRNNSFIAAITDTTASSSNSSSGCNFKDVTSTHLSMFKTLSLDHINEAKNLVKNIAKMTNNRAVTMSTTTAPLNTINTTHTASASAADNANTHACITQAAHKRTPSYNDNQKIIKNMLVNSISLNNIASQLPTQLSKLSVGQLSSLISSVSLKDLQSSNDDESNNYGFDDETFKQIIKAFRIFTLFLPPLNKRKLHLLLRLLYKLKYSDHAKLLLIDEYVDQNEINEAINGANQSSVESIVIKAFIKSILKYDVKKEENLAIKIVQIMINNYSEVMRVPEDFITNVQESLNNKNGNYCSKITVEQYETEKKNESKQHLVKLLYSILASMTMSQDEKLKRLKQFKEIYPDIYEEKYATIKKAVSVLGLNETTNQRYQIAKKRTLDTTSINPSQTTKSTSSAATNSKNLDTTNVIQQSAINISKFLFPKTLKKVKL